MYVHSQWLWVSMTNIAQFLFLTKIYLAGQTPWLLTKSACWYVTLQMMVSLCAGQIPVLPGDIRNVGLDEILRFWFLVPKFAVIISPVRPSSPYIWCLNHIFWWLTSLLVKSTYVAWFSQVFAGVSPVNSTFWDGSLDWSKGKITGNPHISLNKL